MPPLDRLATPEPPPQRDVRDHLAPSAPPPSLAAGAERGRRTITRSGRRVTMFIGAALVALIVVPLAMERYKGTFRRELRGLTEPGSGMVVRLNYELAQQAAALHDYAETRDEQLLARVRRIVDREALLYDSLAPLARGLGDPAESRLRELRALDADWHAAVDRYLERVAAGDSAGRDPLQGGMYDDVLLATARLHQAFEDAAQLRLQRIVAAERVERIVMGTLGAVALLALMALSRLAERLDAAAETSARGQRAALDLMEWRARLMRGVSHDLKNPLSAVDGHAQLLEDEIVGPLNPAQHRSVQRIRHSVQAMLRLVEDLLELYRAESGRLPMRLRPLDLREVACESVEDWQSAARTSGHELSCVEGDALPTVVCDPERVRQVLGNLLTNAMRHTPRGGRIAVRLDHRALVPSGGAAKPVDAVAIDVSDTGPGIPAGYEEEIFAEFARLAPADRRGAGLGLAIARRIARQLGGDLTVTSAPGAGACFTFWVPVDGEAASAPGDLPSAEVARAQATA
jgi:signal transduction histidine kinase